MLVLRSRVLLLPAATLLAALPALPQATVRASVDSSGVQADAGSIGCAISPDGRYVAFDSPASNLVPGDANGLRDVFVRDLATGATTRVTIGLGGAEPDGESYVLPGAFADDGQTIVFTSDATNLVAGDHNGTRDVFVRPAGGAIERVTFSFVGGEANGPSVCPSISGDGRYVAYATEATNLVGSDTNGSADVFVHDRVTGIHMLASTDSNGVRADEDCLDPFLSADGRFVVFVSKSDSLAGGTSYRGDVYVKDLVTGVLEDVHREPSGVTASSSAHGRASLSRDGRWVAFKTEVPMVPADHNARMDAYAYDRATATLLLLSDPWNGDTGNGHSGVSPGPIVSADGTRVAFASPIPLMPTDGADFMDIYVYDIPTGLMRPASVSSAGNMGARGSRMPAISADGRWIAFNSFSANLVPGDTNGVRDVFMHDFDLAPALAYCPSLPTSGGCVPVIGASGTASASAPSPCTVSASGVDPQRTGLLFYGYAPLVEPFLGGVRCVRSPVLRTSAQSSGGAGACTGTFALDFNARIQSGVDPGLAVGALAYAQYWFRDPGAPSGVAFSNALELRVNP